MSEWCTLCKGMIVMQPVSYTGKVCTCTYITRTPSYDALLEQNKKLSAELLTTNQNSNLLVVERDQLKQELANAINDNKHVRMGEAQLMAKVIELTNELAEAREAFEHVGHKMGNEYLKFKAERDHALESVKMAVSELELVFAQKIELDGIGSTSKKLLAKLKERHGELK